ncbi:MAG: hypothetical protein B5M53_04770 [Candidatus Cloacimonas sp. 4484_209]|nr:MAG: hypothetical protein B5M53_04770 [Candidatus Cloacimonas sp. 4484_209]
MQFGLTKRAISVIVMVMRKLTMEDLSMKKLILIVSVLFCFANVVSASYSGWIGVNRILKVTDSDRIEFTRWDIDITNRFDLGINMVKENYVFNVSGGIIEPMSMREFIFGAMKREKYRYTMGAEINVSKVSKGLSFYGSEFVDNRFFHFTVEGKIALFNNYGCLSPGIKFSYSEPGYIDINASLIDTHRGRIYKSLGIDIFQQFGIRHSLLMKVRRSSKNGIEFALEPELRLNKNFLVALESYLATRNNSAFGISLIYHPIIVKKKVIKKPVKIIVKKPVEEKPPPKPVKNIVKKPPKINEKPVEEKPTVVKKSPAELKKMLETIVNGPYSTGVNYYVNDKFEEAIKEWKKALKLLQDESFKDYKDAQDYIERCKRNIEDAKMKLKIINEG